MNSLLRFTSATAAAAAITITAAQAQSLSITAPGYTATKLFDSTPGYTIGAMAVDGVGDVFYLETKNGGGANTKLYRRSSADNYATPQALFDYGAFVYASFIEINGGQLYFGESTAGTIRSMNLDGSGVDLLGSIAGNFDAAFSGGNLYLSHNPADQQSRISKFTLEPDGLGGLMLSAGQLLIDASGDYSGPLEFGPNGSLFYGGSGSFGKSNMFKFSASDIATALSTSTPLTLDGSYLFSTNGSNAALAFNGLDAFWNGAGGKLDLIDATNGTVTSVATSSDFVGNVDYANQSGFANVSSFTASAVYNVTPTPEPTSFALLATGMLGLCARRRR